MSVLTQGTQIYFFDPAAPSDGVTEVACATDFNPGGNPADQLEDQCLADTSRKYKPGLRTPGTASMGVRPDPDSVSDLLMHELSQRDPSPTLKWAVGWSDGTAAPTIDSAGTDWNLPTSRTWFVFEGYIADFPFNFAGNTLVASTVSIQRSGASTWTAKTT